MLPNGDIKCNRFMNAHARRAKWWVTNMEVFRYPEHPRFSDGIPDSPEQ